MEKIKYNKIRLFYFLLFILLILEIVFQILKPRSLQLLTEKMVPYTLMMLASYVFLFFLERKNAYFTSEKVILDPKKNIYIIWDNLIVELDDKNRLLDFGNIYLKSKTDNSIKIRIELNWPTELSAIPILKKYVPKDHELYVVAEDYAKKRGLKF